MYQMFQLRIFCIVCWDKVFYTVFFQHTEDVAFVIGFRIIYPYGVTSVDVYQFHTGNISITIADVYDIYEWNPHLVWFKEVVNTVIVNIKNTFFNPEEKLSFVSVVIDLCRPYSYSVIIVEK